MSNSGQPIQWKRLLVEGVVIVASILLAFTIDAWWDDRQEKKTEERQLLSIVAELESNADHIQEKLDTLAVAQSAARELLSWMGPEPRTVTQLELTDTFSEMYSIGAFALLRGATEKYLSDALVERRSHDDVRKSIADWYAKGDDLERQYAWLREAHAGVGRYLIDTVPMLHFDASHPDMQGTPSSRFPLNQSVLLSDPRFESRISFYLIRIRFVEDEASDLIELQAQLLELIKIAADN